MGYSQTSEPIRFERDCVAVMVPQGETVTLPAGQAGYITQAVILCPAQCHRLRGLAFEVDDVDIAVRHQHLAEMQVTVNACKRRTDT